MLKRRIMVGIGMLVLLIALTGCGNNDKSTSVKVNADAKPANSSASDLNKLMAEIKGLPGYSCEMAMVGEENQNVQSKLWGSGSKLRMEMEVDGVKNVMLINAKGEIWNYIPAENMAIKMPAPPEATLPTDWAASEEEPQIVGQEKVDGYECLILTYPQDKDTRCWIIKDRGLPVKIESLTEGKKTLIEYKNYNINPQPENLFEVPTGAQVVSMPGAN